MIDKTGLSSSSAIAAMAVVAVAASAAMLAAPGAGAAYAAGTDDFVTTWKVTAGDQNVLISPAGDTVNYAVDWGDGKSPTDNVIGDITYHYSSPGTYTVRISGDFTRIHLGGDSANAAKLLSIDQWGNATWSSMESAFATASNMVYRATDVPDLSGVTDMSSMFHGASSFNGDISSWDVSSVTDMSSMFKDASSFNQPLHSWDTSSVTDMSEMFLGAHYFAHGLDTWDTSSVTDMSRMFMQALYFNGQIHSWDVSSVTDMSYMFASTILFNQPIGPWDVSGVTDMSYMFYEAASFSQNLGNWYIVPGDTEVGCNESRVTTIAAQNAALDAQGPEYGVEGGPINGILFEVGSGNVLKYTGNLPHARTSYDITVGSSVDLGRYNSKAMTIAVVDTTHAGASADTVGTVTVTMECPVSGVPRAADFGIKIGSTTHSPTGTPAVSGTGVTLALPAGTTVSNGDTVKVKYDKVTGSTSNIGTFAESNVTNNIFVFSAFAAGAPEPNAMWLSWTINPTLSPSGVLPAGSKFHLQYKPTASSTWNTVEVDRARTSYQITGLQSDTAYDFRASVANSAGARISDYGTASATTAAAVGGSSAPPVTQPPSSPIVSDPTYSGASADTVGGITLVTDHAVTGVPRAADFGIKVGNATYSAPTVAPAVNGTTIAIALPAGTTISSNDTVKIRYTKVAGSTSDLATFAGSAVTNNVLESPGSFAAIPVTTSVAVSWDAVPGAPQGSKYMVQYRAGNASDWNDPVDKGTAGLGHVFGGLSPSTQYDFRAYLANGGDERISDHATASAATRGGGASAAAATATVAGKVFNDTDRDGSPDGGEAGLAGISVLVYDYVAGAGSERLTGASGGYSVAGIGANQVALSQIVLPIPPGHLPSAGTGGLVAYTPLLAGGDVATIDFALYRVPQAETGTIAFDVYHDRDGDGTKDDGEAAVSGATVFTFELLTHVADVQTTGTAGSTTHAGLVPDTVLAQISYSDPATGKLLLPGDFTRITTPNAGAEYVTVTPGGTHTVQIGLAR